MEKYIKPSALADRWDCSVRSVYRYIDEGYITAMVLPNGSKRILLSSVEEKEVDK